MQRNKAGSNLKIQKVEQKAKRPQNKKKNIPAHQMTMLLKRLVKKLH